MAKVSKRFASPVGLRTKLIHPFSNFEVLLRISSKSIINPPPVTKEPDGQSFSALTVSLGGITFSELTSWKVLPGTPDRQTAYTLINGVLLVGLLIDICHPFPDLDEW